jgi:uracil-DNA glycosylase
MGLADNIPLDWRLALGDVPASSEFIALESFLNSEWRGGEEIYPPRDEIFAALGETPLEKVKAVVFGQDPYHGPGEAHGLAFSVRPGVKIPPSLRNIFKELHSDMGIQTPANGDLTPWAKQGVLLLNATLTVRRGSPNAHAERGWEIFTDAVAKTVSKRPGKGAVFILWGKNASAKRELIDEKKNAVLESSHPSPFSAHRGFLGSKPFSKTNAALSAMGTPPIDWNLPTAPFQQTLFQ